jgi:dipeptidase D
MDTLCDLPDYVKEIVEAVPGDKRPWIHFMACTQIPRGSNSTPDGAQGKHIRMQTALIEWGKRQGFESFADEAGNVIIRRAAAPGMEDKPAVCLQCHYDIVCESTTGYDINFDTDPIKPEIDGEWITAHETSLGADNGIGIGAALALLEDKTIKTGILEALITRDEETGLFGAAAMPEGVIKAKYLINVDSEEEYSICIGCAGGWSSDLTAHVERAMADGVPLRVSCMNMLGGHSGVDIHEGRANALKVLARVLKAAEDTGFMLVSMAGGSAHNAIPRDATAVVMVPADKVEAFKAKVSECYAAFVAEYERIEHRGPTVDFSPAEPKLAPMTVAATMRIVNFVNAIHHGAYRMSPDIDGLVETSFTLAVLNTNEAGSITGICSARSSRDSQLTALWEYMQGYTALAGVSMSPKKGAYPGWMPNPDSPLTKSFAAAHLELMGKEAHIYSIHAGLECGLIQAKYPGMDCTSIGPDIRSPHSPDEKMLIASVDRFYQLLKKGVERLMA